MPKDSPETLSENDTVFQNKCPACGSQDFSAIGPRGREFDTVVGERLFHQPDYESRRCERCHLVFKSVIASATELDEYYRRVDFRKWDFAGLHPTERHVVAALRELPLQSRVLDFGCSSGRLLRGLTAEYQCFGYEINTIAAHEAATHGIIVLEPDNIFGESEKPQFDAIVLVDVFEHFTEPTDLLRKLVRRLSTSGRLILCTGDSDAPAVREEPSTFWYFRNVEHVCMLNRQHAEFLSKTLGLKLTFAQNVSHYDTSLWSFCKQSSTTFAFEVFHRNRLPWLKPALKFVPKFRRAQFWRERPACAYTADHLVLVFQK